MENRMLSISDGEALSRALRSDIHQGIKRLLQLRGRQVGGDIADQAHFCIVEPQDTIASLEEDLGFPLLVNPVDGTRPGELGYTPGWEWTEDHGYVWELCFIFTDSGYAHIVVVPKEKAIDPQLRAFCAQYAPEHE